jgi:single-stranded DNA-binding protein
MALNKGFYQGRIPSSDKLPYDISDYGTDEKKAVLRGMISVQRSYKKEGEKYYEEDLLFFKAFGATAVFMNKYIKRGDNVILECETRKDQDYEKNGETVRGQMYLHVVPNGVYFQKGNVKEEGGEEGGSTTKASSKSTASAPAKSNPLANKGAAKPGGLNPLKRSVI